MSLGTASLTRANCSYAAASPSYNVYAGSNTMA